MTWIYATNPNTGTVHLVDEATFVRSPSQRRRRTVCGMPLTSVFIDGDETQSGMAATCGTCKNRSAR